MPIVDKILSFFAVALVTVGVGIADAGPSEPAASSAALAGLSPESTLSLVDAWGMSFEENKITSYITPRAIHVEFPAGEKKVIDLPKDRMVVSIAPYIMKTHPCAVHTMSSCRGEQANMPVKVTAVAAGGQKLLEAATVTLPNGFVDLWLPRDLEIDVTVEARGLRASGRISTDDKANTCITTLRLHY